jgi:hypothetical protein
MPGEAVDAAAAQSPPALLPAPTSIPAGAVADSPTEPPVAADVEMAEVPLPLDPSALVIPDPPIFDHKEGADVVAEVGERRLVSLAEERPDASTAEVPDASTAEGPDALVARRRTMARRGEQRPYPHGAQSQ